MLQQELVHKQAIQVVKGVVDDLLEGIRCPDRPKSAIDAYITEQEVFSRINAGVSGTPSFM